MSAPTTDGAVTVESILGLVRERADEVERTRRIPDDVVDAIRRTGLNRMLLPAALGGREVAIIEVMDAVERIAAVDGSTAWCAVIGCGSNVFAGSMTEAGAREVFADPDQGNATMLAPAGRISERDGGYVLNGRWPFTSNCLHSTWAGLGALLPGPDGGGPEVRIAFVPTADLTIEDTWDSHGLRGTGSHHVTATDVPVDLGRCSAFGAPAWPEGTLWRLPVHTVLIPLLVSAPLGIARGALDELTRRAQTGRAARRGQLADDPISLADLGTVDARLRAARAGVREAVGEAHALAARHEPVRKPLQARIALACHHACDAAVEATTEAHRLGGGADAYAGSRVLRGLADVHAARQHVLFSHHHRAVLTRALAGFDVTYPPFIL